MIAKNNPAVVIYRTPNNSNTQQQLNITTDIINITATDKTYIGGVFEENGAMEVEFISNDRDTFRTIKTLYRDIYMMLSFVKLGETTYTQLAKRYYFTTAEISNDPTNPIKTITLNGVDNIGILPETTFTYTQQSGSDIIGDVITELNNRISVTNVFGKKILSIKIVLTDEAKQYISQNNLPKFINIEDLTVREVIRCIAEAYNCVVYCRNEYIYIDKYLHYRQANPALNSDNIVKGRLNVDSSTMYTGYSIEYLTGINANAITYIDGDQGTPYSITGNPFIQSEAQAKKIISYQKNIHPINAPEINISAETHGFELSAPNSYDTMVAEVEDGIGWGYTTAALYSREFAFDTDNNSYTIGARIVGSGVFDSDIDDGGTT